jgi:AraC-like DNA-binding protein
LGMTARTLQRRLQDEALGFTALVDEVRLAMARRYLADPSLSIAEVSFALGYSEPSAFTRAFKRWSGRAPAEYRESARASGDQ